MNSDLEALLRSMRNYILNGSDHPYFDKLTDDLQKYLYKNPEYTEDAERVLYPLKASASEKKTMKINLLRAYRDETKAAGTPMNKTLTQDTLADIRAERTRLKMVKRALKTLRLCFAVGVVGLGVWKFFSKPDVSDQAK